MAWLVGWNRRKPKLVKGSTAGAQTDYQLKLTVYKGSGIDTVNTIYLGGYVNNDFRDLRFTSSDETTLLPYWIESYTSGVSAIVWVKIDSIPADPFSKFIYIYYDNLVASPVSNGTNVLIAFDDFERGTTMGGSLFDTTPTEFISTVQKIGSYSACDPGNTAGCCGGFSSKPVSVAINSFVLGWSYYMVTAATSKEIVTGHAWLGMSSGYGYPYLSYWITGWNNTGITIETGKWMKFEYQVPTSNTFKIRRIDNGGNWSPEFGSRYTFTAISLYIRSAYSTGPAYVDNVYIRKYASPEPIWDQSSSEQTYTANLTVSSTPTGAEIWINNIDQGVTTTGWFTLNPSTYAIMLTKPGYEDYIEIITLESNQNAIVQGNLIPIGCTTTTKYSSNIITLKATPKDGTGPYYVEFRKNGVTIDPSRLGGLSNPIPSIPENTLITRVYTLDDLDISSASTGTIDFSVYMEDSCPTGAKICIETCTTTIGCIAPICNFTVT